MGFIGPDCGQCAPGWYGPDCISCPGGPGNACNGHGACDDGKTGTGACQCEPGWSGTACDIAVECGDDFDGDGVGDNCDDDLDGDGVLNDDDVCDYTPLGAIVGCNGALRTDLDGDCDTDLADFALFQADFAGPGS
jgi:hypothetical protein